MNHDLIISLPENFIGQLVHVDGWKRGCVFKLTEYNSGKAVLITPKTGKRFETKNKLTLTNKMHDDKIMLRHLGENKFKLSHIIDNNVLKILLKEIGEVK